MEDIGKKIHTFKVMLATMKNLENAVLAQENFKKLIIVALVSPLSVALAKLIEIIWGFDHPALLCLPVTLFNLALYAIYTSFLSSERFPLHLSITERFLQNNREFGRALARTESIQAENDDEE